MRTASFVHGLLYTQSASWVWLCVAAGGERRGVVGRARGPQAHVVNRPGAVAAVQPPFPVKFFVARMGAHAVLADGAIAGFTVRTRQGDVGALWRSDERRAVPTKRSLQEYRDRLLDGVPPGLALYAEAVRTMPNPDSLPHFTGMMSDGEERVWLRRDHFGDSAQVWLVINSTGAIDYFVRAPPGVSFRSVTRWRVYGVAKDDLDVESAVVYELVR